MYKSPQINQVVVVAPLLAEPDLLVLVIIMAGKFVWLIPLMDIPIVNRFESCRFFVVAVLKESFIHSIIL